MRKEAEKALSESILVAMRVTPRGLVNAAAMKGAAASIGGLAGAALAETTSTHNPSSGHTPGGYNNAMFLAVTPTRIAFFRIEVGITAQLGSLIADYPRSHITAVRTARGRMDVPFLMTRPIEIETVNDGDFTMETVTPVFLRGAVLKLEQEFQQTP